MSLSSSSLLSSLSSSKSSSKTSPSNACRDRKEWFGILARTTWSSSCWSTIESVLLSWVAAARLVASDEEPQLFFCLLLIGGAMFFNDADLFFPLVPALVRLPSLAWIVFFVLLAGLAILAIRIDMKCYYVVTHENIVLEYNMQVMCNWMWCIIVEMYSMIVDYVLSIVDYDITMIDYNITIVDYSFTFFEIIYSIW